MVIDAITIIRSETGHVARSVNPTIAAAEVRRIARDLHDSTAQNLLGATLGIGQALRLAPRLNSAAKAALDESRSLAAAGP